MSRSKVDALLGRLRERDTAVVVGGGSASSGGEGTQGPQGPAGPQGDPGVGVPPGGTDGQVLTKQSATDYDTDWETPTGGSGGHTIQEDGSDLPARSNLNFGTGLSATDDNGNDATDVDLDATTADIPESLDKRYVTDSDLTTLANTSGVNTGDQDLSGYVPTSRTVNGHALSANVTVTKSDVGLGNVDNTSDANKPISTATQTALDGKVDENASITGATKTKITYDAKGLVTAGADATTTDISEGSNLYFTDERAQDAVGGMVADTDTLDLTYTDATPELKGDVKKQMSITSDASGLKLSGDATTPGNSKYYGTDSGGTKGFYSLPAGGNDAAPFFGTGADGDVTIAADTTVTSDLTTGLKHYNNLTINSTKLMTLSGIIYVAGTLTIDGTINGNGGDAAANVAGTMPGSAVGAPYVASAASVGNAGGNGAVNAGAAGNPTANPSSSQTVVGGGLGGAGGATGSAGGAAGVTQTYTGASAAGLRTHFASILNGTVPLRGASVTVITGAGTGGGGGAGNGASAGGGGGGGGAFLVIIARYVAGSGTIRANGGNGASPTGAGNRGGGGGGGGGFIALITSSPSHTFTITVTKGTGAAGLGTGGNGSDGNDGNTFIALGV